MTLADLGAAAADVRAAGSIGFRAGDVAVTYSVTDAGIEVRDGAGALEGAATLVSLSPLAWGDLVAQTRTFINLLLARELTFERGGFEQLADWDPVLKLVHAGIPIYDPARCDLSRVDLDRAYTLDDDDEILREALVTTGYLHVRGVFAAEEMASANAEVDRLAELARPNDGGSWWVDDESGATTLCRLVYAGLRSPLIASLEEDPRVTRLGHLLDPAARAAPDRMEGTAVLLKVPGQTTGLSNIPWHQDCGMGGHAILCPAASVGIQLTGSSAATGHLVVVPGSHGQSLHYLWAERLRDVPTRAVDTEPGDVTVHVQDLMHASPRPEGEGGRRTMYVTYYPAALWDHIGPGQAFNDLVRDRGAETAALQGPGRSA